MVTVIMMLVNVMFMKETGSAHVYSWDKIRKMFSTLFFFCQVVPYFERYHSSNQLV